MARTKTSKKNFAKKNSARRRNESSPEPSTVGTSSEKELNAKNSPEVRDALNESQLPSD